MQLRKKHSPKLLTGRCMLMVRWQHLGGSSEQAHNSQRNPTISFVAIEGFTGSRVARPIDNKGLTVSASLSPHWNVVFGCRRDSSRGEMHTQTVCLCPVPGRLMVLCKLVFPAKVAYPGIVLIQVSVEPYGAITCGITIGEREGTRLPHGR